MSTKSNLVSGDNFRLYTEAFEENKNVYLELTGTPQFEASYGRVVVTIPAEVWEVIRKHTSVDFDLIDKTDEELKKMVTEQVNNRMEQAKKIGKHASLFGFFAFGSVDDPPEEQIKGGLEWYFNERANQRELVAKIKALEKK